MFKLIVRRKSVFFLICIVAGLLVSNRLNQEYIKECLVIEGGTDYLISDGVRKEYKLPLGLTYFVTYGDDEGKIKVELEGEGVLGKTEVPETMPTVIVGKPKHATSATQILGPIIAIRCGNMLSVDDTGWNSFSLQETPVPLGTMPPFA